MNRYNFGAGPDYSESPAARAHERTRRRKSTSRLVVFALGTLAVVVPAALVVGALV